MNSSQTQRRMTLCLRMASQQTVCSDLPRVQDDLHLLYGSSIAMRTAIPDRTATMAMTRLRIWGMDTCHRVATPSDLRWNRGAHRGPPEGCMFSGGRARIWKRGGTNEGGRQNQHPYTLRWPREGVYCKDSVMEIWTDRDCSYSSVLRVYYQCIVISTWYRY